MKVQDHPKTHAAETLRGQITSKAADVDELIRIGLTGAAREQHEEVMDMIRATQKLSREARAESRSWIARRFIK